MSKALIIYFSQGGTTARVAEAIGAGLRGAEYQVDLRQMKDGRLPEPTDYDLLGIGSPVYYFGLPLNVMEYVEGLPDLSGIPTFTFVLHGTYRGSAGNLLRRALARKGAQEVGHFHCRGTDLFLGYLKQGYLFSPDHPTPEELAQAEVFGREAAAHSLGSQYFAAEYDRRPPVVYCLERLFTGPWLASNLYSRLFRADGEKCTACGLCMKLCPTKNISRSDAEHPVWGRNCLLCLTCELKCPEEAITSVLSWSMFLPFLIYNVRRASRDPLLDHVRVVHRRGRTQRV